MDYRLQQTFLIRSRIWGAACVILVLIAAWVCLSFATTVTTGQAVVFILITIALASSLFYSPDYLHLSVDDLKAARWQIKIRWRIIPAAVILGILLVPNRRGAVIAVIAGAWLAAANFLAKKILRLPYVGAFLLLSDLAVIAGFLLVWHSDLLLASVLSAAAVHLALVTEKKNPLGAAIVGGFAGLLLLFFVAWQRGQSLGFLVAVLAPLAASAIATAWLVHRAQRQNANNISTAMRELTEFTGYPPERVRRLWSVSNQELAKNWVAAGLNESDPEQMAQWYRDNSELYMFAISGYNLEYKRIRSNLGVLRFARGACLDYGAGNGELLLELARRGHPAAYYDVEGASMRFARFRAQKYGLAVDFYRAREELRSAAHKRGFDTIFSFDVLEHIPDLRGELLFLSSLLNAGGVFVFDVPAGATKSHPMHLNHRLNVSECMQSNGMKDARKWFQKPPLRKEEKYIYCAPA